MSEEPRLVTPLHTPEDEVFDRAVRPKRLSDYVGQPRVKSQMEIFITAARQRRDALDHTLLFGPG
jgi:Holliday junction DNA helicase RuvB